jgi:hypothetical protein
VRHLCCAEENPSRKGKAMTEFKVGDAVRLIGGSSRKWRIDSFADGKARIVFRKKLDYGMQLVDVKDIVLVDPQADIKQAIREVLLGDEFIEAFTKKAFGAKLEFALPTFTTLQNVNTERSTLEHPVPGVNRPMRSPAKLSKMVEMVRQSLTAEANSPEIPDSSNSSKTPNSSIELPSNRFYREPTLADLANGPIACEYRDDDDEQWRSGFLVYVLDGVQPFLGVKKERRLAYRWDQCQIEVSE